MSSSVTTMGAAAGRDLEPNRVVGRPTQDTTPCPVCSDTKGRKTGPTGKDLHERVLRQRRCASGHVYTTVEVALPPDVYFSDVDYFFRQLARDGKRRRNGSTRTRARNKRVMEMLVDLTFRLGGKSVFRDERGRARRRSA